MRLTKGLPPLPDLKSHEPEPSLWDKAKFRIKQPFVAASVLFEMFSRSIGLKSPTETEVDCGA